MVITLILGAAAIGLGAAQMRQRRLQGQEQKKRIRESIAALRAQQAMAPSKRRLMEGQFERQKSLLPQQMAARGRTGASSQLYRDSLVAQHEYARGQLKLQEGSLAVALRQARRGRRIQQQQEAIGYGSDILSMGAGIASAASTPQGGSSGYRGY